MLNIHIITPEPVWQDWILTNQWHKLRTLHMTLLHSEFILNDCLLVHSLAPNKPIYQLDLARGSLVLKTENRGTRRDLKHVSTIMRFVDAESEAKPLSPREIVALSNLAHRLDAQQLTNDLGSYPVWEKMMLKTNILDLKQAMENRRRQVNPDKTGIRKFATVLNAQGGLEKLGAIVAADCFNGNGDRFILDPWYGFSADESVNYGEGFGSGQDRVKLKCLINVGNVFIATNTAGDASELLGLDMYDPNSNFNDWTVPLQSSEQFQRCYLVGCKPDKLGIFCSRNFTTGDHPISH